MSVSMPDGGRAWRYFRFGLIVTGEDEAEFLPDIFRSLAATGRCSFRVIRRIGQRSPIRSPRRRLRMMGSGKQIPNREEEEIGLPARTFLSSDDRYVLLIDDLEAKRSGDIQQIFDRYRLALDTMLLEDQAHRASVHFLVKPPSYGTDGSNSGPTAAGPSGSGRFSRAGWLAASHRGFRG